MEMDVRCCSLGIEDKNILKLPIMRGRSCSGLCFWLLKRIKIPSLDSGKDKIFQFRLALVFFCCVFLNII